ncbi:hypothetical protein GG344DRAFT_71657, partial [Lentinula edodes]
MAIAFVRWLLLAENMGDIFKGLIPHYPHTLNAIKYAHESLVEGYFSTWAYVLCDISLQLEWISRLAVLAMVYRRSSSISQPIYLPPMFKNPGIGVSFSNRTRSSSSTNTSTGLSGSNMANGGLTDLDFIKLGAASGLSGLMFYCQNCLKHYDGPEKRATTIRKARQKTFNPAGCRQCFHKIHTRNHSLVLQRLYPSKVMWRTE